MIIFRFMFITRNVNIIRILMLYLAVWSLAPVEGNILIRRTIILEIILLLVNIRRYLRFGIFLLLLHIESNNIQRDRHSFFAWLLKILHIMLLLMPWFIATFDLSNLRGNPHSASTPSNNKEFVIKQSDLCSLQFYLRFLQFWHILCLLHLFLTIAGLILSI